MPARAGNSSSCTHLQHALLNGPSTDQPQHHHAPLLSHAVRTRQRLQFDWLQRQWLVAGIVKLVGESATPAPERKLLIRRATLHMLSMSTLGMRIPYCRYATLTTTLS